MRLLIGLLLFSLSLYAQKILVINSNSAIDKYKSVESSFTKSFNKEFKRVDISKMSKKEIKEYLYDEYPDIVYAIGAKAYQYANRYIPEKRIYFSSIVNYKRLGSFKNRSGVSNELHSGMHLTLINSLFADSKVLSMIYSDYTKDLFESFRENARAMGIEINGEKIKANKKINMDPIKKSDGFIMIADPILLKDPNHVKSIFSYMKKIKKPVFAYHELFIKFGAALSISVDEPTVGRQIASMINDDLKNKRINNIQVPMGTNVIFNKKSVDALEIKYNRSAFSVVNRIIE